MIDMSKEFYLRTCTECHKAFYTEQPKKRLCLDCFKDKRKKHSEAQHKSVKKPYTRRYIPPYKPKYQSTIYVGYRNSIIKNIMFGCPMERRLKCLNEVL